MRLKAGSIVLLWIALLALPCCARVIRVSTADALKSRTSALVPDDTLLVTQGMYDVSTWDISGLRGRSDAWIVIRAEGNAVVRGNSGCCNLVQMSDLQYVAFEGFELTMAGQYDGIDGVNLRAAYSTHVRLANLHIHHMTNNGISLFPDSADNVELLRSEIDHCTTCGLYWGYPGRNIVHDILIQGNYIHHSPSDSASATGYGIQLKGWSYRVRILDNVLHDVGGTTRSGLIVYYGKKPLAGDIPADINIVAGNAVWNCRSEGITAMSDALIENNVVFDAGTGINLQTYSDESFSGTTFVENLTVRNNTVFRCRGSCIALSGWGQSMGPVSLIANAAYQPPTGGSAISGSAGSAKVQGNVFLGTSSLTKGAAAGTGLSDFLSVNAQGRPPSLDFYPSVSSALLTAIVDAGLGAPFDFNHTARTGACNAGAYQRTGVANPGWTIQEGFKAASGPASIIPAINRTARRCVERNIAARLALRSFARDNATVYFDLTGKKMTPAVLRAGWYALRGASAAKP